MQKIEAVLFDWGGVLIDNPAPALMRYCAEALGVSVDRYTRAHDRHAEAFQTGVVGEEEFWRRVCGQLGRTPPQGRSLWGRAFRAVYSPRGEVFALAQRLHDDGCKVGLLSNTEAPSMEFFQELRYAMFDAAVFSCAEGHCKPEREIYEIATRRVRAVPGQCVLIDDRPSFAEGARRANMQGIVYESLPQVRRELIALGIRGLEVP